ncbi:CAP domain-containing protein [Scheffersomyces xylosifermentans]|uniref:CAP domain-containing protein n=1 Tax=Scheffersomyces xylosifermentans TaxID=1304137 RepID=UPI00315CBE67
MMLFYIGYLILVISWSVNLQCAAATVTEVEVVRIVVSALEKSLPTASESPQVTDVITVISIEIQHSTATEIPQFTDVVTITSIDTQPENSLDKEIYSYKGIFDLDTKFASQMLQLHNEKRDLHGAQLLSWNSSVFEFAANFALQYSCSGILNHSGGKLGENLAIGYSTAGSIEAWYNEGNTYQYGTESAYNHFTAMIWNSTNNIGCAYKYCNPVWGTYIVCSYYPAGNVIGYSVKNVFPPI